MTSFEELAKWLDEECSLTDETEVRVYRNKDSVSLQFYGWEIVLRGDGTYYANDTTGG